MSNTFTDSLSNDPVGELLRLSAQAEAEGNQAASDDYLKKAMDQLEGSDDDDQEEGESEPEAKEEPADDPNESDQDSKGEDNEGLPGLEDLHSLIVHRMMGCQEDMDQARRDIKDHTAKLEQEEMELEEEAHELQRSLRHIINTPGAPLDEEARADGRRYLEVVDRLTKIRQAKRMNFTGGKPLGYAALEDHHLEGEGIPQGER